MTGPFQQDLFGGAVTAPAESTARTGGTAPVAGHPREAVNDMDLTQTVLADIADGVGGPLHLDDDGRVRRCTRTATAPVPDELAAVVEQLLAAQYLTTRTRSCPGHGALITTTRTGSGAVHRWRAYRRPSTWGPSPETGNHNDNDNDRSES